MALALYLTGTSTLATTHTFTATAGTPSAAWGVDLWLNRGTAGGVATNIRLSVEVYSGGVWVTSGVQALDKAEFRIRCIGFSNPQNDPLFVSRLIDWVNIGSGISFAVNDLRGDCAHVLEVEYAPRIDTSAASGSVTWRLALSYNENLEAAGVGVSEVGGMGILTGLGDYRISEWITAPTVAESGTPDALANIGAATCVIAGAAVTVAGQTVTLNQNDSVPSALTAGQAYIAILTMGATGTATVTKGVRAALASVVAPAAPAGELALARVVVNYQAVTSIILNADITVYATAGRGIVAAATGLDVTVARLRAIVDRALVTRAVAETVTLADDTVSSLYLSPAGAVSTTVGPVPLADVTTAAGAVTLVTDRRRYVARGLVAVADATDAASVILRLNDLLAQLRAGGVIAT